MYDSKIHHRRSIRWDKHNYSSAGAYFVTICIHDHHGLLGNVADGIMNLNDAGRMVDAGWREIPARFPTMTLDEYVVMPNHFHGIIHIVGAPLVGARVAAAPFTGTIMAPLPTMQSQSVCALDPAGARSKGAGTRPAPTLGDAVDAFKSLTTDEYIRGVKQLDWPRFDKYFWQRNYFEHIIRNPDELEKIRQYIQQNPLRWTCDRYNPENSVPVIDESGHVVPRNES